LHFKDKRGKMDQECAICQSVMSEDANISITCCNHKFHSKCILRWSARHNSCPCCREPLYETEKTVRVQQDFVPFQVSRRTNEERSERQQRIDEFSYNIFCKSESLLQDCITLAEYILLKSPNFPTATINRFHNRYFFSLWKRSGERIFADIAMFLYSKNSLIEELRDSDHNLFYSFSQGYSRDKCNDMKQNAERFLGEEKIARWNAEKNGTEMNHIYYNQNSFVLDSQWHKRMWKTREENDQDLCMELYNLIHLFTEITLPSYT
jgi:hypothetical protein